MGGGLGVKGVSEIISRQLLPGALFDLLTNIIKNLIINATKPYKL